MKSLLEHIDGLVQGRSNSIANTLELCLSLSPIDMLANHQWGFTWGQINPDSKVYGANLGPIWGRQDPGGPHVGPMNLAIWEQEVLKISILYMTLIYDYCQTANISAPL